MISTKSMNNRLNKLREMASNKNTGSVKDYKELRYDDTDKLLLDVLVKVIGKDFINRLEPLQGKITHDEAVRKIMGILTNEELERLLEMEEE